MAEPLLTDLMRDDQLTSLAMAPIDTNGLPRIIDPATNDHGTESMPLIKRHDIVRTDHGATLRASTSAHALHVLPQAPVRTLHLIADQ